MKIFGLEISRISKNLVPVSSDRGWINLVHESFPGAWQRNITVDQNLVTSNYALFACITLIASDLAKLRVKFIRLMKNVWQEDASNYDALLRRPNPAQNRIQFWENYFLSKLMRGNTYVLKRYDQRPQVSSLYVLDPSRVQVLVSQDGEVFYQLMQDNWSGILATNGITVPSSEIIHDRMNCLFHPLVGLSPIYAAGLAAMQGLAIQNNATKFFTNRSVPGGIITAPQTIPPETAERLKKEWNERYGPNGNDQGKTAILGDGLEFKPMAVTATDAQMLEQLKWTAEAVCSCFHVPPYKVGVGAMPSYNNIEALNLEYYSQALQSLIEAAEECLDQGLGLDAKSGVMFDVDNLARMDSKTKAETAEILGRAGVVAPNETRAKFDLPPVTGGESPLMQQQNYSLAALSKRDAKADPFASAAPKPAPTVQNSGDQANDPQQRHRRAQAFRKGFFRNVA